MITVKMYSILMMVSAFLLIKLSKKTIDLWGFLCENMLGKEDGSFYGSLYTSLS